MKVVNEFAYCEKEAGYYFPAGVDGLISMDSQRDIFSLGLLKKSHNSFSLTRYTILQSCSRAPRSRRRPVPAPWVAYSREYIARLPNAKNAYQLYQFYAKR